MTRKDRLRIAGIFVLLLGLVGFVIFSGWAIFRGADAISEVTANATKNLRESFVPFDFGATEYNQPRNEPLSVSRFTEPLQTNSSSSNQASIGTTTPSLASKKFQYILSNIPRDYNLYNPQQAYQPLQTFNLDKFLGRTEKNLVIPVLGLEVEISSEKFNLAYSSDNATLVIDCIKECPNFSKLIQGDITKIHSANEVYFFKVSKFSSSSLDLVLQ